MITAKIILDSINPAGNRLTTFELQYPRFIHSELMTHRQFSRNASSSRAIPVRRVIEEVKSNPAMPLVYLKNRPGMQGGKELPREDLDRTWLKARDRAVEQAEKLAKLKAHKQIVNRILEPFSHITVLVSSTTYSNFFALRYHSDAQPEIYELAKQMYELYTASEPKLILAKDWHLPYVGPSERESLGTETALKLSVARCARVSYKKHDGTNPSVEDDIALHDRLLNSNPMHASPAEHQAEAWRDAQDIGTGNFRGWIQYRKRLPNECIDNFKLKE